MIRFVALVGALAATGAMAQDAPYAGQEGRPLAALSAEDVVELRGGGGWGLAKSAEFNGWPGPRHALDLRDALALTPEQATALQTEIEAMGTAAIAAGDDYLAAEAALDAAFRSPAPTPEEIAGLSEAAGAALATLRTVHLTAHVATRAVLSPAQTAEYIRLRGYGGASGRHGGGSHGHP